jgi:hypothetical protein
MKITDLRKIEYDELIQLYQDGKIDTLQFVTANEETAEMFENSCRLYNLEKTNEVAELWLANHNQTLDSSLFDVIDVGITE